MRTHSHSSALSAGIAQKEGRLMTKRSATSRTKSANSKSNSVSGKKNSVSPETSMIHILTTELENAVNMLDEVCSAKKSLVHVPTVQNFTARVRAQIAKGKKLAWEAGWLYNRRGVDHEG